MDHRVHPSSIAVASQKGGTGKTALTANIASVLGGIDIAVLVVNTDPQPNLEGEFGAREHPDWDRGRGLMEAMRDNTPLTEPTITNIKPNIDMVCGGPELDRLREDTKTMLQDRRRLATVLEPLVFGKRAYDAVLIDTAPDGIMLKMVFPAVRGIVIPLKEDAESTYSLEQLGEWVTEAAELNPMLRLLGIVQVGVRKPLDNATKRQRAQLEAAFPNELIPTSIRKCAAAVNGRELHLQASDFLTAARAGEKQRLADLKDHKPGSKFKSAGVSLGSPETAAKYAHDVIEVTETIMTRLHQFNDQDGLN